MPNQLKITEHNESDILLPGSTVYDCFADNGSAVLFTGISNYAILTFYDTNDDCVELPDTVLFEGKEYPVRVIGTDCLPDESQPVTITVPDTVTMLDVGVFRDKEYIKSVKLSENLTVIGDNAFAGCLSLSMLELPESLHTCGRDAFFACDELTTIVYSEEQKGWLNEYRSHFGLDEDVRLYTYAEWAELNAVHAEDSELDFD